MQKDRGQAAFPGCSSLRPACGSIRHVGKGDRHRFSEDAAETEPVPRWKLRVECTAHPRFQPV